MAPKLGLILLFIGLVSGLEGTSIVDEGLTEFNPWKQIKPRFHEIFVKRYGDVGHWLQSSSIKNNASDLHHGSNTSIENMKYSSKPGDFSTMIPPPSEDAKTNHLKTVKFQNSNETEDLKMARKYAFNAQTDNFTDFDQIFDVRETHISEGIEGIESSTVTSDLHNSIHIATDVLKALDTLDITSTNDPIKEPTTGMTNNVFSSHPYGLVQSLEIASDLPAILEENFTASQFASIETDHSTLKTTNIYNVSAQPFLTASINTDSSTRDFTTTSRIPTESQFLILNVSTNSLNSSKQPFSLTSITPDIADRPTNIIANESFSPVESSIQHLSFTMSIPSQTSKNSNEPLVSSNHTAFESSDFSTHTLPSTMSLSNIVKNTSIKTSKDYSAEDVSSTIPNTMSAEKIYSSTSRTNSLVDSSSGIPSKIGANHTLSTKSNAIITEHISSITPEANNTENTSVITTEAISTDNHIRTTPLNATDGDHMTSKYYNTDILSLELISTTSKTIGTDDMPSITSKSIHTENISSTISKEISTDNVSSTTSEPPNTDDISSITSKSIHTENISSTISKEISTDNVSSTTSEPPNTDNIPSITSKSIHTENISSTISKEISTDEISPMTSKSINAEHLSSTIAKAIVSESISSTTSSISSVDILSSTTSKRFNLETSSPSLTTPKTMTSESMPLSRLETVKTIEKAGLIRLGVSITFLIISLSAAVILIIYIIKVRRHKIQYEELKLLP